MLKIPYTRAGFMLCAFLLPGLIGTFASFAIPAPVVDELHQAQALDAVLTAPTSAAQQAALNALPDEVDPDTAAMVLTSTGPLPARVAAAEQNMRVEVVAEARSSAYRIRLLIITMTALGAAFGILLLGPEHK
jgi:hypothetical protein